jgi:dTDP-4-dehydrorhamnose reductase
MILLLGSTGYIGQAFAQELQRRGKDFIAPTRKELDYTRFETLLKLLRDRRPEFLVNAAGYTGKPNVDACEIARADTLQGNTLFPQTIAHACATEKIPWGHVSSGCIFAGAKITENGGTRIEKDLTTPAVRELFLKSPDKFTGFNETEDPNFSFRSLPCSFYSGTKALGEEAIHSVGQNYIWRLRIPFDQFDNPRNYLSKIQNYPKVYENINSLSHRADFVRACLDLWERRAPFGIYNVTNPGAVATSQVVAMIERILKPNRKFEFWANDEEFYRVAAKTPRSNCIMDVSKLLSAGVAMRPVDEALEHSLKNWTR